MFPRGKSQGVDESHNMSLLSDRSSLRFQRRTSSGYSASDSLHKQPAGHVYQPVHSTSYDNGHAIQDSHTTIQPLIRTLTKSHAGGWKPVLQFIFSSPLLLIGLVLGFAVALACFAFTYWLATQVFICPVWTVNCKINSSAHFFAERLGLVQGIVSTIYGISIAGMVYATYELAEATLWPMLVKHALSIRAIDRFLAHARGSLASFPYALWYSNHPSHAAIVILVGLMGILLQINSTIVGYSFTVMPIATLLQSQHAQGGAMGFGWISQTNPPGVMNGEIQRAYNMYSSWSNEQATEILPDLRNYVIDRGNFSTVGNFTVNAVRLDTNIKCYPQTVNATFGDMLYEVSTNLPESSESSEVVLRVGANGFTVWMDSFSSLSNTRGVATLIFATLNSTFEDGYNNDIPEDACGYLGYCSSLSTLACDVDINLVSGQACNGKCTPDSNGTVADLTWLGTDAGAVHIGGDYEDISALTIAMAAAPTQFGPYIYGAQPYYTMGSPNPNSTYALPEAWSDQPSGGHAIVYSQANVTNFINVTVGAVAMAMPQGWPGNFTIIESKLALPRLDKSRSYVLLIPPGIAILSVLLLATMNASLHRKTELHWVRLGTTSDVLLAASEGNVTSVIEEIHESSHDKRETLQQSKWKLAYGGAGSIRRGLHLDGSVVMFQAVR